jgi:AbiV family abortive infection protein
VDLRAVKAATRPELAVCAIAAARNAQGLLQDAELLAGSGRTARAYSLAALAVEECGKAMDLTALAVMPERLRAQAPVGRMLEWHQLKLVGGLLMAVVPLASLTPRLADMPAAELAQTLSILDAPADETDRLKRRGFYVDMDRSGRTREPSEITEPEVRSQLRRARQAGASAFVLLGTDAQARLASPAAESVEFAQELVTALAEAKSARTPRAAAEVIHQAIEKYRARRDLAESQPLPVGQPPQQPLPGRWPNWPGVVRAAPCFSWLVSWRVLAVPFRRGSPASRRVQLTIPA